MQCRMWFFCLFVCLHAHRYMRESDCERAKGHKRQWCCPLFWWCRAGVGLYESRWVYYACLLPLRAAPRQKSCVPLFVYRAPVAHTVVSSLVVSLCRSRSLSNYFLLSCFSSAFPLRPTSKKKKKRKILAFIHVDSGGFKAAILKVRVTLCKRLRKGMPNKCFLQVEHYNTTWFSIRTVIELLQ